jgi:hypothetical protein
LILCDRQGNFFRADEPLAAGETQNLVPLPTEQVHGLLSGIVNSHEREFPEGYDPVAEERRTNTPWNRMYWGSSTTAVQETGILESNIAALKGTAGSVPGPGMYVAVLEKNPDVPLGVSKVTEAESFHLLVGRW